VRTGSDSGRFVVGIRLDLGGAKPIASELKPFVLHQEAVTFQVAGVAEHYGIALSDRFDAHTFRIAGCERARDTA
jgi:hypothetical protein